MPNIKSAKKRVKVIEKKTLRNNMIKSGYKSAIKNLNKLSKLEIWMKLKNYFQKLQRKLIKLVQKVLLLKTLLLEKNLVYQKN